MHDYMTELFLIRHGETDWNAERRLQGHTDIGLNAKGERQAEALGIALEDQCFDAVISSDLVRAKNTAQAIAERQNLSVQVDLRLRERCYGAFESLTYAEIGKRYPEDYAAWQARHVDVAPPPGVREGESLSQFYDRVLSAVVYWARYYQGKKIALISHGGVLECVYRAAMSMPLETPRNFAILNAGINRLTYQEGKLALINWGETAHLELLALDEVDLHTP